MNCLLHQLDLPNPLRKKYVENYETEYISATDRLHSLRCPTQDADEWNDLFELMERSLAEQIARSCWRQKGYIFIYSTNLQGEIIGFSHRSGVQGADSAVLQRSWSC